MQETLFKVVAVSEKSAGSWEIEENEVVCVLSTIGQLLKVNYLCFMFLQKMSKKT